MCSWHGIALLDMKITFSFYLFLARKSSEKMKKHEEKFLKNVIIDAIITVFLPILGTIIASLIRLKPMPTPTF